MILENLHILFSFLTALFGIGLFWVFCNTLVDGKGFLKAIKKSFHFVVLIYVFTLLDILIRLEIIERTISTL